MNILITGAAGYIGSYLCSQLANKHVAYGLEHDRHIRTTAPRGLRGDVTDFRRILEIIVNCEIDQIYHLAAKSIVRNCQADPVGCLDTNVIGTATILEAARQSGRVNGIMVMESDKSYGHGPVPYAEDQALRPEAIYEASKACVSHVMSAYHHNYGLPVFSIRSANVYGGIDRNRSRLIPNTITRLLRGESPQVTDGADCYAREFLYIDDAVLCMTHLMEIGPWGQAVNIGSGETGTVAQVIHMICDIMRKPMATEKWVSPPNLSEIPTQSLCLDKLKTLYSDYVPTTLREGLKKTIATYEKQETL